MTLFAGSFFRPSVKPHDPFQTVSHLSGQDGATEIRPIIFWPTQRRQAYLPLAAPLVRK